MKVFARDDVCGWLPRCTSQMKFIRVYILLFKHHFKPDDYTHPVMGHPKDNCCRPTINHHMTLLYLILELSTIIDGLLPEVAMKQLSLSYIFSGETMPNLIHFLTCWSHMLWQICSRLHTDSLIVIARLLLYLTVVSEEGVWQSCKFWNVGESYTNRLVIYWWDTSIVTSTDVEYLNRRWWIIFARKLLDVYLKFIINRISCTLVGFPDYRLCQIDILSVCLALIDICME